MKRPDLVLAGAVVLCLPMAPSIIHGNVSATSALERFLLALIVSWFAAYVLSSVIGRYSNQARRAEIMRQIEEAAEGGHRAINAIGEGGERSPRRTSQDGTER